MENAASSIGLITAISGLADRVIYYINKIQSEGMLQTVKDLVG